MIECEDNIMILSISNQYQIVICIIKMLSFLANEQKGNVKTFDITVRKLCNCTKSITDTEDTV